MASKSLEVNTLNIALIVISLVLAYKFPFELFLLAYAILGPLHYVTEINWLDKKNYFVKERKQVWILVGLTALIAVPFTLISYAYTADMVGKEGFIQSLRSFSSTFAFAAVITAIALVLTKNWWIVLGTLIVTFVLGSFFEGNMNYGVLFGGLLPTIIHVFAFTFFFMLYGAFKDKSKLGILGAVLMLVVPFIVWYVPIDVRGMEVGQYFQDAYTGSKFTNVNYSIGYSLGLFTDRPYGLMTEIGVKVQVFIAFAYTYHYLNWFSKTTVIGWHKVIDKKRLIIILSIWTISLFVYFINYFAGFVLLLFLSYLHVLMEFPLNWHTIKEVFVHIFTLGRRSG